MPWQEQRNSNVKFVDWGELKEGHEKETCIVIKKGEKLQGLINSINQHDVFGYIYRLKVKDEELEILVTGSKALNRQMMGTGLTDEELEKFTPVKEGDKVRLTYNGMYTTKSGGKGYDITVAVNR